MSGTNIQYGGFSYLPELPGLLNQVRYRPTLSAYASSTRMPRTNQTCKCGTSALYHAPSELVLTRCTGCVGAYEPAGGHVEHRCGQQQPFRVLDHPPEPRVR
eukprot:2102949-Rhodomonas_salina.2